ncbi:MAG: hypothetical protein WA133_01090 [Syntrophales bacterium]
MQDLTPKGGDMMRKPDRDRIVSPEPGCVTPKVALEKGSRHEETFE